MTTETLDSIGFFAAPGAGDAESPPAAPSASTLSHPAPWFVQWAAGNAGGDAPPVVNEQTVLNYLAVYSCVGLIAGSIASLPLIVYRRNIKTKTRERATDARVYRVLHDEFNPRMSSAVARETSVGHLLTWGNCFSQVVRNKSGSEVQQINPLGPDVVDVRHDERTGAQVYDVYQRGDRTKPIATLAAEDVLHVPAIGFDGICGYSQARIARNVIRAGMATEREMERFASRGFRPPGAIRMQPGKKFGSTQEAIKFIEDFKKIHMQSDSSSKVVILQDGAEWVNIGVAPDAAKTLETQKFTRGEIAGMYHVPPHMIGDVEKSTSWGTGIAEQVDGFIKFALLPWLVKIEQEKNRKLFGGSTEYHVEHLLEGLERADILKRTEAYSKQVLIGMRMPNECRETESMNPHPGGNVLLFPSNYIRVDEFGDEIAPAAPPANPSPGPPAENAALAAALRKAVVSATGQCLRKEAAQAKRAAAKPGEFVAWLDAFYGDHVEMVADKLQPLAEAWESTFGKAPFGVVLHVERSRADLLAAADGPPAKFAERVEKVAERWLSERVVEVAGGLVPLTKAA
jgi:HK97 family phage portal protein